MPGQKYDGSITIDTKLDNTGFSKGSDDLKHAVQSLTDQVNDTGRRIRDSFKFDFGQPKQAANTFSDALREVNAELKTLGDLAKQAIGGDVGALEQFQSKSELIGSRLADMKSELDAFGKTDFETPEFADISGKYQKAAAQVEELTKALEDAEAVLEKMTNDFGRSDDFMDLEDKIDVLRMYKEEYDAAMKRGDMAGAAKAFTEAGVGRGGFEAAIQKAEAEMDKMWEKFENSAAVKNAQKEIDKVTEKLEEAKTQAANYKAVMDGTPASFKGSESTEYLKDTAGLQGASARLLQLHDMVEQALSEEGDGSAEAAIGRVQASAERASKSAGWLSSIMKKAFSTIVSGAKNVTASFANLVKNGVTTGVKKLGGAIADLGKHTKKSNGLLGMNFKTLLKYGLGIRSTYILFRKLRAGIMEGFGALAQHDAELNQSINNFKIALATLKNSFAAAFAPIVQIAIPYLTALINTISAAVSKVGQLIAALTGQATYKRAVASQAALTSNANNAGDAMGNEAAAAKELQKTLAGFDDVEILHDNSSKLDKGQTAGGNGAGDLFEEVPIEDKFADLAQKIREMWKNADFTELGTMLGEKLKNALEKIPWGQIKATLRRIASSIATFLNGFLEVPGLFDRIGYTLAQGLNSAFSFMNEFVKKFHWASLGTAIKDFILGAIRGIDWPLIYDTMSRVGTGIGTALESALDNPEIWEGGFRTISHGLNSIVLAIRGFLGSIDWLSLGSNISNGLKTGMQAIKWSEIYALAGDFGTDLAEFLNGLFKEDTFAEVGATAARLLNTAFEFLNKFGENFNFAQFGSSLAAGINRFLNTFNTARLTAGVSTFVTGLRDAIIAFLDKVNWYSFGTKVRDIIVGIDWINVLSVVGSILWGAINSVIETAKGVFSVDGITSPFVDALTDLQTTISTISEKIDFATLASGVKAFVDAIKPAASGFAAGIIEFFEEIIKLTIGVLQKIGPAFQSIADAINSLPEGAVEQFGTDLATVARALILIKGATAAAGAIKTITGALASIGSVGAAAGAGATAAATGTAAAGTAAGNAAGGLFSFVKQIGENIGVSAMFTDALNKLLIPGLNGSKAASEEADEGFRAVSAALFEAGISGDTFGMKMQEVQSPMDHLAFDAAPEFGAAFGDVAKNFEDAGGDVETFKATLQEMLDSGAFNAGQAKVIQDYIGGIGSEAVTSTSETSEFAGVFDAFESLGWSTPIKMALISGAIKALGESGVTSKEDTNSLYDTLNNYNANPTQQNMLKVETAFKNAGVSAKDFVNALATSAGKMDPKMAAEVAKVLRTIKGAGPNLSKEARASFKNIDLGAAAGMKDFAKVVSKEAEGLIKDSTLGTMDTAADMHSPSQETHKRGQYLAQGLGNGLKSLQSQLISITTTIMNQIKAKIDSYKQPLYTSGSTLMTQLKNGMSSQSGTVSSKAGSITSGAVSAVNGKKSSMYSAGSALISQLKSGMSSESETVSSEAGTIASGAVTAVNNEEGSMESAGSSLVGSIYTGMSTARSYTYNPESEATNIASGVYNNIDGYGWGTLGYNIIVGIYNGMVNNANWLYTLAWNVAVGMYNEACDALGIASPSKEFYWVGEMLTKGLGNGVKATQDQAIDAVSSVADAIMEEAQDKNPTLQIDTAVDGMDSVLTTFSDKVVKSFDSMITAMEEIVNGSSLIIPVAASGTVIPYSARKAAYDDESDKLSGILQNLALQGSDRLTRDDLAEVLASAFRQYMNIDFYIGDEQIARHANAGSAKLNRRYSTTLA